MDHCEIVKIRNLSLFYGKFQALKNVNVSINENEVTSFIGSSGCGKSTCLRSINRMNDLYDNCRVEGKVLVDGQDVYDKEVDVTLLRKQIGMVFQRPNLFRMSIFDNISYGPRSHGIRKKAALEEIVESVLKSVYLWDKVKDRLHSSALDLSGGQQQRLCIARALAVKPRILLMDEPTSALDPSSTLKIEDLILNLKKKYTVVIVTHNMQQAARISDSTAFFKDGKLIEQDDTYTFFNNPNDKQIEDYINGRSE